jgi:hypothetical protein
MWLASAFNEYHSAAIMAEMSTALIRAQAPLDLCTAAAAFAGHELVHAELCARLSVAFGPCDQIQAAPPMLPAMDRGLSDQERCHRIVMRVCVVGESLSLAWITAMARQTEPPVIRRVLRRILKDEALHRAFGWMYLDWALPVLDKRERARVRDAARRDLESARPNAFPAQPTAHERKVYRQVGILAPDEAATVTTRAIREIRAALAHRGLPIELDMRPSES